MNGWVYVFARGLFFGGLLAAAVVMHTASGLLAAMVGVSLSLNVSLVGFLVALSARSRATDRSAAALRSDVTTGLVAGFASPQDASLR